MSAAICLYCGSELTSSAIRYPHSISALCLFCEGSGRVSFMAKRILDAQLDKARQLAASERELTERIAKLQDAIDEQCRVCDCHKGHICVGYHEETQEYEWNACPRCSRFQALASIPPTPETK